MSLRAWSKRRRTIIRRWIPQGVRDLFNHLGGCAIHYRGVYPDWAAARAAASGYDDAALLERLVTAARKVKSGEAAWEQDGVTWDHVPPDWPLFAALCRIALAQGGRLAVLDFGGGFGSSYFQCRTFLAELRELRWGIAEQPALVAIGQNEIARDALTFYPSLASAIASMRPSVVLLSSVLQYLEHPWAVLDEIIAADIPYLIIDRHPCSLAHELITVQIVPPSLYPASYPSWLFDCTRMRDRLTEHYELLAEWEGKDSAMRGWGIGAEFRGYLFKRGGLS